METVAAPPKNLEDHRLQAAEASGGISSDVIYNRVIEVIQQYNLRGRALDFGAGIGNLTKRLWELRRFDEIAGSDILPRPAGLPAAINWHCVDLNHGGPVPASSFDTLISAEVIEHLENPREVAREWHRILKPGGTLVMSTPNNESVRALISLIMRGHFVAFDDSSYPAHITALVRKDIVRVLTEARFRDIRFEFTNSGDVPKTRRLKWQRISLGLLKGCRFSDNIIAIATK